MKQQVRFAVFLPSRSTSSRPLHHDVTAVLLRTVHDKRANLYIFTGRVTCHSRTPLRLQWVASGKLLDKYCYCNPVVQTMWYWLYRITCDRKSPHFVACCASHSFRLLHAAASSCDGAAAKSCPKAIVLRRASGGAGSKCRIHLIGRTLVAELWAETRPL